MLVTCAPDSDSLLNFSQQFAQRYNYKFSTIIPKSATWFFYFDATKELFLNFRNTTTGKIHKLSINFTRGKNAYRLAKNTTIKQPIAKAVGIRQGYRPDIIDVTAGLGKDAFVLASLGCKTTLVERSPILYALLENGLQQAYENPTTSEIVSEKMRLAHDDSIFFLNNTDKPHTIYMDPMYPHRSKSALNKIEMRMLRELVGDDTDATQLLNKSIQTASNRVVVKRPGWAKPIESKYQPTHSIDMKSSRFDVYLI